MVHKISSRRDDRGVEGVSLKIVFPPGKGFVSFPFASNPLYRFSPGTIKGHINRQARMFADINLAELVREYLRHTDCHLFSGGPKRLQVMEWVNSFWLLNLFGTAKAGINLIARMDSWLADIFTAISGSSWYVICEKPDEQ